MPDETHFSEDDVAAIFQSAIQAQEEARNRLGRREGLTLDELKEIGADLGITPDFIERAAAARKARVTAKPDQKILGIPVSVERVLALPRPLTDDEWGLLVADLRDTFAARGAVENHGSLRQWTNGNLSAMIEPATGGGYQLRLRTLKGNAEGGLVMGGMFAVFGILLTVLLLLKDLPQDPSKYAFAAFFLVIALGTFAFTATTVPRWHRERSRQMDLIAGRVSAMVSGPESGNRYVADARAVDAPSVDQPEVDLSEVDLPGADLLDVDDADAAAATNQRGRGANRSR
jgi:hypothetical protein